MGVITANITIGIIQEIRAKKTIDKLSLLSAPTALVIRDGEDYEISIQDVVIDDILFYLQVSKFLQMLWLEMDKLKSMNHY
jgi:cation-transporting P-type ATPase E